MPEYYLEFGELIEGQNPESLTVALAKQMFDAVDRHPAFKLLELRRIPEDISEILIVECKNDKVWTKGPLGLKYRERLALRFFSDGKRTPEVRTLRKDFPDAAHQNHVEYGEPKSLCLYLDQWPVLERTWTPAKHLNRVLYWLTETANESLHLEDQPVEQVYFEGAVKLVLPSDFDTKVDDKSFLLMATPRPLRDKPFRILVGSFVPAAQAKNENVPAACVVLTLPPIVHRGVEHMPNYLGELHDQLAARGAPVGPMLFDRIKEQVGEDGIGKTKEEFTLLVLRIPIIRQAGGPVERTDVRGFMVTAGLGDLGVAGEVLVELVQRYQRYTLMGEAAPAQKWRDLAIQPIECLSPFTREYARDAAGLTSKGPNGALIGVGALGSAMANIWYREGWGTWAIIDADHVSPHNLARHAAFECHVGAYKVDAVNTIFCSLYGPTETRGKVIPEDARDFQNPDVAEALESNDLIVDATTTLEFPRDLSTHPDVKRAVSVFLTPSGLNSVMLMEDSARGIPLDILEAQYYRAILSSEWGEQHLAAHSGHLRVGGGCRDISAVMPLELIGVHSATLARQIRLKSECPDAAICVWHCDHETGHVRAEPISPSFPRIIELAPWKIVWDEAIRTAVRDRRKAGLPNETGGVLLGYFDLKLMRIYIVDALPAPADSVEDRDGFTRGIAGLAGAVQTAQERTANIVSYIGEWHSHPAGAASNPSDADMRLLTYLAERLQYDGLPALMLIVGEAEETFLLGQLP